MNIVIKKSNRKDKRYKAIIPTNQLDHVVHFGSDKHENYLDHKDFDRMRNYRRRASKQGNVFNFKKPLFWSFNLTWSEPDYEEAIDYTEDLLRSITGNRNITLTWNNNER